MQKQIHILIVDDDTAILRLFSAQLAKAGFEILPAHDGNEGREMARRFQPDLILLDINMPVMDGYKAFEYMKREEETRHIPIIFLTNEDFSIEAQKAGKGIGADGYIPKSERREMMIGKINEVLKRHGHELPDAALREAEPTTPQAPLPV